MAVQEPIRTKGFVCKHCGIVCSNMPSLIEHMESHMESDEDRKFKCEECGRGYRHAGSLANHKKTHEVGSFQCPICSRQLSNSLALKNHLRIHTSRKKYSCMDCGKAFRLATQLATHQRVHRNREARAAGGQRSSSGDRGPVVAQASSHRDQARYKDGQQSFNVVPDLEPDMGLDLPVDESFSGSEIPDILPGSASSDQAAGEDAEDRPYKCNLCDKSYRHYGSLNNHKKTHQVGTFECAICFKQFSNMAALTTHQRTHSKTRGRAITGSTNTTPVSSAGARVIATSSTGSNNERRPETCTGPQQNGDGGSQVGSGSNPAHFCHLCQVTFPSEDEFQDHILLHNSSSVSFELPVSMPDDDGFAYSASQSPDYPPSSDTPPMPPLLDKQDNYGQSVSAGPTENGQVYIPDSFQGEPPLLNSQGEPQARGSAFADPQTTSSSSVTVANHHQDSGDGEGKDEDESSPDGERRFKCDVCNKSYRHAGSLINHKRSHQTGIYQCSVCRKHYPHLAALRSHHRIHRAQTTSAISHGAEGDWLSSEPQTLDSQHSGYPLSEEEDEDEEAEADSSGEILHLPEELRENAPQGLNQPGVDHESQGNDGRRHQSEPMSYHEQYDTAYGQDGAEHLPHGEPLMERHMCADCGKTFGDIASIKSHVCPHHHHHQQRHHPQQQQHHSVLTNGSNAHQDYQGQHLIGESGAPVPYQSHGATAHGYYPEHRHHSYHPNMHRGMMGSGHHQRYSGEVEERVKDEEEYDAGGEEEEDGDMYHCSVCGNHYASLRALRSHLRSHTQVHGTPSSSGPSSMSSLEPERDDEVGGLGGGSENQSCEGSLVICSTCGQSFTRKQDLVAHQLLHSQASNPMELPPPLPPPPPLQMQPPLHYASPPGQHYSSPPLHHYGSPPPHSGPGGAKLEAPSPVAGGRSIICCKCGISCVSVQHLENHPCPGRHADHGHHQEVKREEKTDMPRSSTAPSSEEPKDASDRLFKCEQCGRAYRHAGSLLNHKKSHKTGVFRCYVCQKRFYNLLALKSHERTHFDIKKHTCSECGKAFKIQKQLQNHLRVHEENKAKIQELNKQIQTLMQMNGELAQNGLRVRKTQRRRRRNDDNPSGGNGDASGSGHPDQMKDGQEVTVNPDDPRPYVCNQCGRSYRHAGSLVNHKNSHKTGEFHCSICSNTYPNQLAMKNHLRIHFGLKKHGCQECGKAFRGKKQLLSHRCAANRKNPDGTTRPRGRRRPREPTCRRCHQTFPTSEELRAHECTAPPPGEGEEREERPYKCGICGRSYRHAGSLLNHKNTHKTGNFSCSFCSKPFSNPMALRNHTRIHTQTKKHVCPTCGKAFRLSSILHNHLKIHARGICHFNCSTCGKTFQGRSGLKRHRCGGGPGGSGSLRSSRRSSSGQGGGDKCYTCDQCGRSYRHAGSLLNHKKTHSADLLHCSLCLRTFDDPLALESHSQMPRHCCPDCGKTFCEFAHMQSHMEVHSKGRPLQGARGGGAEASGSGYLHHPHGMPHPHHHQQMPHPHPHHQPPHLQPHSSQAQQPHGYPHPGGIPVEEDMDWDPRMNYQGGVPKMEQQAFGPPGSMSGRGDGAGNDDGYHGDLQDGEDGGEGGAGEAEKSHVCEHCGRAYRHAGSLLNHKNSHKTGSFFCTVCQKEFTNLMALKNHRRIHTEPKRYQCLECGKTFRVSTQLICHRRIHTKEKPFACLLCDKRFSSKSNLRHHQKMHQNSQASYEAAAAFDMDPNAYMGLGVDPFL